MKETTLDNSIESKRRRRRALKKTIEKIMNAVFFVCGAGGHCRRSAHHRIYGRLRPAGHPGDRPARLPVRHRMEVYCRRAEIRHSAVHPHQHLGHAGSHRHRRARGPADGGVPFQGGQPTGRVGRAPGGGAAGGHTQRGVRPHRHDGAGAGCDGAVPFEKRHLPVRGHSGACHHDSAVHHLGERNGAERRAARV